MKKYTRLRKENRAAAENIAAYLKKHKAITQADFKTLWCKRRGWTAPSFYEKSIGSYYGLSQNYDTTIAFLCEHGIMTKESINGMAFFIATQKCIKSKPKNFFLEEIEILQSDIQKAVIFQQAAAGLLDPVVEGMAIAKVLGLTGDVAKEFGFKYPRVLENYQDEYLRVRLGEDATKYAIFNMVAFPKEYFITSNYIRIDDVPIP